MKQRTTKTYNIRIIITTFILVSTVAVIATVAYSMQPKKEVSVTRMVKLSPLYRTYASVNELMTAPDASFVGRVVILDDGTVRSRKIPGAPLEAPPEVNTDYRVRVESVIKGSDVPSQAVIALMGGTVQDTRYVYEFVPRLHKGDSVIVFALKGEDDGKYYPLAGSTAVALQQKDDRSKYRLGDETLNTGALIFTEQDLIK